MFNDIIKVLIVLSLFLVAYHHILFPLILKLITLRFNNEITFLNKKAPFSHRCDEDLPSIEIIVPAYNEEQFIAEKIHNLASLDYPCEKLTVTIGCDGCSDKTADIAKDTVASLYWSEINFKVINFSVNRGKIAVVNELVKKSEADLIAFSDVSALISIDALLIIAMQFENANIGAVTGAYKVINPGTSGEEAYWKYQANIKKAESIMGSTIGAHGAFYAMRRALFSALPSDTINDDFIIPMKVVEQGFRVAYEPQINAVELEGSTTEMDWKRRLRIGAGNIQQVMRLKQLFLQRRLGVMLSYFSGKVLRVVIPFLLLFILLSSAYLGLFETVFMAFFIVQIFGYGISVFYIKSDVKIFRKVGQPIAYIVLGHFANLCGAVSYLMNSANAGWKK